MHKTRTANDHAKLLQVNTKKKNYSQLFIFLKLNYDRKK